MAVVLMLGLGAVTEAGTDWPLLMSAATLIATPAVIGFLLIGRHLTGTMAMSGVTG
ncbi:MAG TPA: hypothetical protein VHF26_10425 [Trebonia sp.]|nr:hypothetical protein [Trebonia sp.]